MARRFCPDTKPVEALVFVAAAPLLYLSRGEPVSLGPAVIMGSLAAEYKGRVVLAYDRWKDEVRVVCENSRELEEFIRMLGRVAERTARLYAELLVAHYAGDHERAREIARRAAEEAARAVEEAGGAEG